MKTYTNADLDKFKILGENRGKAGIYMWINNINGKRYIGSSNSLTKRFHSYYSKNRLTRVTGGVSLIYMSILKHGHCNFSLDIMEYIDLSSFTDKDQHKKAILEREQYYLDLLKPEYNILKKAGSRLGVKLTPEGLARMSLINKGRKHTPEARLNIGNAHKGRVFSNETKEKIRLAAVSRVGICIKVNDTSTKLYKEFPCRVSTAQHFNISPQTVSRYLNKNKAYKGFTFISSSNHRYTLNRPLRCYGVKVKVFDKLNDLVLVLPTIASAALHFKVSINTIHKYLDKGKSYNGFILKSY